MANSDPDDFSFFRAFATRLSSKIVPRLVAATVPIVRATDSGFRMDRTGVLLKIEQQCFILTASHGLRERVEEGVPLGVALRHGDPPIVPLVRSHFYSTETELRDVAALNLSAEDTLQLCKVRNPISLRDVEREDSLRPDFFVVLGYPQEWFEMYANGSQSIPVPFISRFYDGESEEIAGMNFNPDLHGLFDFQQQVIRTDSLIDVPLPDFDGMKGISGCGIWRICDASADSVKNWKPENCQLVAIQHRYHASKRYVHATWVKFAVQRIIDENPSLGSAMSIIYPRC